MNPAVAVVLLALLVGTSSAIELTDETPPRPPDRCSAELVAMSACLPHVAAAPNNATASPSDDCCGAFLSALDESEGGAACLCYLVRDPSVLGFPLNASRLLSLFSSCGGSVSVDSSTFNEICRGSETLPPLPSIANSVAEADGGPAPPPARNQSGDHEDRWRRGGTPGRKPPPSRSPPRPRPPPAHKPPPEHELPIPDIPFPDIPFPDLPPPVTPGGGAEGPKGDVPARASSHRGGIRQLLAGAVLFLLPAIA